MRCRLGITIRPITSILVRKWMSLEDRVPVSTEPTVHSPLGRSRYETELSHMPKSYDEVLTSQNIRGLKHCDKATRKTNVNLPQSRISKSCHSLTVLSSASRPGGVTVPTNA